MSEGIVFVIDDDAGIRRALERLISSVGLTVETFDSAQAFLDRKPPEESACVVTDVRMPGISGLDLQKELADADIPIPVIVMTGHGTVPMSVRAMKAGAVDFLQKPIDEQVLLDAVHQAIDRDRQSRARQTREQLIRERVESLTPREREVFQLLALGRSNKEVARELDMSVGTAKKHRENLQRKLDCHSAAELARLAIREGLLDPD